MIDDRHVADVDLAAFDERRHRDHDGEVLDVAFEIVGHRQDRAIAVANQHDLRRTVEQFRVGLRDVETAERLRGQRHGERQRRGNGSNKYFHCLTPFRSGGILAAGRWPAGALAARGRDGCQS